MIVWPILTILWEQLPNKWVFGVESRKKKHVLIFFKQLLSVCATLGEDPIIRYQSQSEGGIHPQGSPAGKLAHIVQKEVDNFCRLNPNFPVSQFIIQIRKKG